MILLALAQLAILAGAVASTVETDPSIIDATCKEIATAVPFSSVYYSGLSYEKDVYHWASSSAQAAACSFEPSTVEDLGVALQIISKNRCPFGVKGGGHATNPGFSSTPGVQIAMYRFSEVTYDSAAQTVTIGAGLIWDDVYAALEPHGVNVVGGRVTGVGVAGLTLGGGYSWLTNQHGLTIDTMRQYELVLPNGTVIDVTQSSDSDLFFALKGGYNNFGIVTKFTLEAFPQGLVWGGTIYYDGTVLDQVIVATADFSVNCKDPKAQIITSFNYGLGMPFLEYGGLQPFVIAILFYDGPTPPNGMFDRFLEIPSVAEDISTRSFLSLVQTYPTNLTAGARGVFNTVSVESYPVELLQAIADETTHWGESLGLLASGVFVSYWVEPFLATLLSHNTSPSAYPGSRERAVVPLDIYFAWLSPFADEMMQNATRMSAATLASKMLELNQDVQGAPLYPNYAIYNTPLEDMYGDNLKLLHEIRQRVDPNNVMGLTGGFKF